MKYKTGTGAHLQVGIYFDDRAGALIAETTKRTKGKITVWVTNSDKTRAVSKRSIIILETAVDLSVRVL